MTRQLMRRPSRWQVERAERRDRKHREVVAAELVAKLGKPLTEAQVLSFRGEPEKYVQTLGEARAHAYATGTAASWIDSTGALIVTVDAAGTVVELGPGRWP